MLVSRMVPGVGSLARWTNRAWVGLFGGLILSLSVLAQAQASPQGLKGEAAGVDASRASADEGPQIPDIFEDYSQVEQVAADTTRAIVKQFLAENPSPRRYPVNLSSQDHERNDARPALRLEQVWVGEKSVLLEIKGLPRRLNTASAVMRRDTLQVRTAKGDVRPLAAFDGVTELRDRRGGSALVVAPGDSLYLLFDKFDDYFGFSLLHVNRDGRESIYFDGIDPRFRERYDAMHAAASTPLGMKDFLVEFANNDPDKRVMPVFARLLGEMRKLKTFEGYHGAFQLLGDPKDYEAMRRAAVTDQHKAVIKAIEDEKLAEVRRREEARLAEVRRQEAARLEQQRVADARAAEERCMATPSCRQAVEDRRAACAAKVNQCRRMCDSVSGGGTGIFGMLASAVVYRGCASQCKCDNALGDLFATMNRLESNSTPARSAAAPTATERGDDKKPHATNSPRTAVGQKTFVCKIYCKSSAGPTIHREAQATSPEDAARILGEQADQLCRGSGYAQASGLRLPAGQCWAK